MSKNKKKHGTAENIPQVINFVCRYDLKFNHARIYDDRKKRISPCDGNVHGDFFCLSDFLFSLR